MSAEGKMRRAILRRMVQVPCSYLFSLLRCSCSFKVPRNVPLTVPVRGNFCFPPLCSLQIIFSHSFKAPDSVKDLKTPKTLFFDTHPPTTLCSSFLFLFCFGC